ncbi:glutamate--tRNA ligase [Candidatus Kaiserbacteria bacterium]|nr:glutamate--tRNA ligase [Candidatus Kaiserbacteria bacterium]
MNDKIITRFAPSPTGFMHIGSIRTALFAYLYARKNHGDFILRIEDTDKSREVTGAIEHIQESLEWLGISWDYGPNKPGPFGSCIQSDRLDSYRKYARVLIDKGLAYPDPYTAEELDVFRQQAKDAKKPFLYRLHRPESFAEWDGTKALRLKVPEIKRYTWHDEVRGELSAGEEMLDDIILIKADGYPTYNFAHIIDDLEMGVTHIMRGDEFISSTPKFLSIYDALGIPYPKFVTLPPILKDDKSKKLGKRDGAKDILDYREDGYLPETMLNFLALIGWNPATEQEFFSLTELTEAFSIDHIQKSGGVFNSEKLLWMNKRYLDKLSIEDFIEYLKPAVAETISKLPLFDEETYHRLLPTIRERTHLRQAVKNEFEAGEYDWVFKDIDLDTKILAWKNDSGLSDVLPRLEKLINILETTDFSSPEAIKEAVWPYAEEIGRGEVLWPMRVAITGREKSPDPFNSAYIMGKPQTLERLKKACAKIV